MKQGCSALFSLVATSIVTVVGCGEVPEAVNQGPRSQQEPIAQPNLTFPSQGSHYSYPQTRQTPRLVTIDCPTCWGVEIGLPSGRPGLVRCGGCNGTGNVYQPMQGTDSSVHLICPHCSGLGRFRCSNCLGTGKVDAYR